ncbi:MAG: DEAD/DEAH box helicase [Desulfurococcales archaeon]|nr:DEAD/DEAH box helicase [Desulfurococcales archaeon]
MKGESVVLDMLHPRVREAFRGLGYKALLPIQEKSIPVILRGEHALLVAPTGSGKTEAALLPVLSLMAKLKEEGRLGGGVKAIYITPLRALNRDIERRIKGLVEGSGFTVQVRHGDTRPSQRRAFLSKPPDLMVTTPESLTLLLSATAKRGLWDNVRWVIVDEVHELIESERGAELAITLERLERLSKRRIQRIGLSATLSRESIRDAVKLLAGPRRVEVVVDPSGKTYDISVEVVEGEEIEWDRMVKRVADIIKSTPGKVLVFVNTRATAEKLAAGLSSILGDSNVRVHHGSLARDVREEAERLFKEGSLKALVATSSMELGVDIGDVNLVVQFMSPRQVLAMTQRAGRAGHRFGEPSRAVIVVPQNLFEILEAAVIAFRAMRGHLEDLRAPRGLVCPVAHQLVAITVERGGTTLSEAYEVFANVPFYSAMSMGDLEEVAVHLDSLRILRYDESTGTLKESGRSRRYLYGVSMIPDEAAYTVIDMIEDKRIGEVSERFIEASLLNIDEGERLRFILAGKLWEVVEIDYEDMRITVKPIAEAEGLVPAWQGELIPVDYKVAREVCALLSLAMYSPDEASRIIAARGLDERWVNWVVGQARGTAKAWGAPYLEPGRPVVEVYPNLAIVYVCLGSKGNMALALLLSELLAARGIPVRFNHIPYAIVLSRPDSAPLSGDLIVEVLREAARMDRVERAGLVYQALKRSQAFLYRFLHVARRLGVLDREARASPGLLKRILEAYRGSIVEREVLKELVYDKLDMRALNEYLDAMKDPVPVRLDKATPLAMAVLGNPYLRSDIAVNLKEIALDKLVEGIKRRLQRRHVLMLCTHCGHAWEVEVQRIPAEAPLRCPRCRYPTLAPLPPGDWGRQVVEAYRKKLRGERLTREEKKLVKEAEERASLYMHYSFQGLGRRVVEALLARGVGPRAAKRAVEAYMAGGEREFYRTLMEAEETYVSTRKYWEKRRPEAA